MRRRICASLRSRNPRKNAGAQDQEKVAPETLHEPAQSKCIWTCDKTKSNFMRVLTEKCRSPRSRRKVCASFRNPNAHGHVTRAVLGEFTGKRPAQDRVSEFM